MIKNFEILFQFESFFDEFKDLKCIVLSQQFFVE